MLALNPANPLGGGSLWNNKQQQQKRQRLDCHENTPYFHEMTATAKRMKNNQSAVTANPLRCGSLWKIKKNNKRQNGNGSGLPRNFFKIPRNDGNGNGK